MMLLNITLYTTDKQYSITNFAVIYNKKMLNGIVHAVMISWQLLAPIVMICRHHAIRKMYWNILDVALTFNGGQNWFPGLQNDLMRYSFE